MTRDQSQPPSRPGPDTRDRFRAPEHDRALRVMEAQRVRELAVKTSIFRLSVAAALGLVLLKLGAAWWTNSLAILASGLDSMLDVALSGLNWFSARKAEEPPDTEHPFGHGKVESLVGGIQALILASVAVFIGVQGVERLRSPEPVVGTALGVGVMLISALVALGLSRLIRSRGAASESPLIATEQLHYSIDFTSHAAVILALVLQATTDVIYFDPFVSILIAVFVLWQVRALIIDTAQDLLDRELPEDVQQEIVNVLDEHGGEVLAYHGLRTRRAGSQKIVNLHLVLCKAISFETSHHIVDHVEQELELAIPRTDVIIHADPCGEYCPGEDRCPWSRLLR